MATRSTQIFMLGLTILMPSLWPPRYALRFSLESLFIMKIAVAKSRAISPSTRQDPSHRHQVAVLCSGSEDSRRSSDRRTNLWSRFSEWVCAARQPQDMSLEWTCYGTPMIEPSEAYLGRVESFELSISACAHCGMLWLGVRSVATTVMRTEPLPGTDAEAFLAASPGVERRAMMREWLQRNLKQSRTP